MTAMKCETLKLYDRHVYDGCENVTLDIMIRTRASEMPIPPRPAMLVFGGGGYAYVSARETEPIGTEYLAAGYNVFMLNYTCGEKAAVAHPLLDAALAVATVRKNAELWDIDPDKIAVCGFSAGGHLAASIATLWDSPEVLEPLGLEAGQARPNAAVLGYPVISGIVKPNVLSFDNFLGKDAGTEQRRKYSCENNVKSTTCPCFIFHTANDTCVPVENSIVFAAALAEHGVPFELHILPDGLHGISRANFETSRTCPDAGNSPYVARWSHWAVLWLNRLFENE